MSEQPPRRPLIRQLRLSQLELVRMAGAGANFRAMAEALHVTQPAITKMAQELELALGAPVFDRSGVRVQLLPFGRVVLAHAQRSLTALDQLDEDLQHYREGATPALRIGSPSFTAAVLLAGPVAKWLEIQSRPRVVMSDGVGTVLLASLLAGELDCVIGSIADAAVNDTELAQLQFEPLYDDHVAFVTHADTPGREDLTRIDMLAHLAWVTHPRSSQVWVALRREFATAGQPLPRGVVESSSVPAIGAILSQAPGTVGALRADAARYLGRNFKLKELKIAPVVRLPQVGIVRLRNALPSEPLESMLSLVRDEVRRIFGDPH